jgi:hypothetical protein
MGTGRSDETRSTHTAVNADPRIESAILQRLATRSPTVTICPSEVARALWPSTRAGVDPWREKMPEVHAAATRLALVGKIEITQGGEVVDPTLVRGARRLRRGPSFDV